MGKFGVIFWWVRQIWYFLYYELVLRTLDRIGVKSTLVSFEHFPLENLPHLRPTEVIIDFS